jgi:NADPH:quinone reductase-like Zn-dependent oxidoreductase
MKVTPRPAWPPWWRSFSRPADRVLAATFDRFGPVDVLNVVDVPDPVPAEGEILVRVRAAALNPKDVLLRRGKFRWLIWGKFPRPVGYDWAGEVAAVGPGVSGVTAGDKLFGMINAQRGGACAQFVSVKADECAALPWGLSMEDAAAIPLAALTALQALRDLGSLRPGNTLLIHGASGGVGTMAIQVAVALGAQVTTTSSARNVELCASLGAHQALDYAGADPREKGPFDVVFDVFGNRSFETVKHILNPRGVLVSTVPKPRLVANHVLTRVGGKKARLVVVHSNRKDLLVLCGMVQRGELRPVVDRVFPLAEIRDAQALLETKRARGKVVLAIP